MFVSRLLRINSELRDFPFSPLGEDAESALRKIGRAAARTHVPRSSGVWRDIDCVLDPASFKVSMSVCLSVFTCPME